MNKITTTYLLESEIDTLGTNYQFLKNLSLDNSAFKTWYYNNHKLGYQVLKQLNIIFIGQTGYGKSSLINTLINHKVFDTSDYEACTKRLQSADFFLHHKKKDEKIAYALSFVDLPGIGENDQADMQYLQWYQSYLKEAAVIVYLFRADKRDHTQDEYFFNHIFNAQYAEKLICAISQADKIEPINRSHSLSLAQLNNLTAKELELKKQAFLNYKDLSILPISSHLNVNVDKLEEMICTKLKLATSYSA